MTNETPAEAKIYTAVHRMAHNLAQDDMRIPDMAAMLIETMGNRRTTEDKLLMMAASYAAALKIIGCNIHPMKEGESE